MLELPVNAVDFGTIDCGDSKDFTLPFDNSGLMELEGLVGMEIDGSPVFTVAPTSMYAEALGSAGDMALLKEHIEGNKEVGVDLVELHAETISDVNHWIQ